MNNDRRNKLFDPRITVTHIFSTIGFAGVAVTWAMSMASEDSFLQNSIALNSSEIVHVKKIQEGSEKYMKEAIQRVEASQETIQKLLNDLIIQGKSQ